MCFYQKKAKKNTLKINPEEKELKNKIFTYKDQLYLLSNKDFISRNYQKLQKIKESTTKSRLQFSLDKANNLSFKIKTPNQFDKKLLLQNDSTNLSSFNNKIFFSLSMNNELNKINNKKNINNKIFTHRNDLKKLNKAKSLVNIRNINIISNNKKNVNNNYLLNINNNINKISHNKKIRKHPLIDEFNKIKMFYINLSTKNKSVNFSMNSSINSNQLKIIHVKKNKSKDNNKKNKKEKNKKDNFLVKKELKKIYFDNYISKKLNNKSSSKERNHKSRNIFNELYAKIIQKSKENNKLFLRLKKSNKSNEYSFFNQKNKIKNLSSNNVNDLMTSGSLEEDDFESEENYSELNPEEIHFKAVKYYQEIK